MCYRSTQMWCRMQALWWVVLCLLKAAYSSLGDVDPHYQHCEESCMVHICHSSWHYHRMHHTSTDDTDYYRDQSPSRLTRSHWWSCYDFCRFDCIDRISHHRQKLGLDTWKYFGHWPFTRFLGLEEPASALFSIFNAVPHLYYLFQQLLNCRHRVRFNKRPTNKYFMEAYLLVYAVSGLLAWMASTIYHAYKTERTSFYDYTFALCFLSAGLFMSIHRCVRSKVVSIISATSLCILVIYRIYSMLTRRLRFHIHMQICGALVVTTIAVWAWWWTLGHSRERQNRGVKTGMKNIDPLYLRQRWLCMVCQVGFVLAAMLEVFDFPPWLWVFDAHSLWHAATVPLAFLWYAFWKVDRQIEELAHDNTYTQ